MTTPAWLRLQQGDIDALDDPCLPLELLESPDRIWSGVEGCAYRMIAEVAKFVDSFEGGREKANAALALELSARHVRHPQLHPIIGGGYCSTAHRNDAERKLCPTCGDRRPILDRVPFLIDKMIRQTREGLGGMDHAHETLRILDCLVSIMGRHPNQDDIDRLKRFAGMEVP